MENCCLRCDNTSGEKKISSFKVAACLKNGIAEGHFTNHKPQFMEDRSI